MSISVATNEYEDWLRSITTIDEGELDDKHNKMTCSEFAFLRATFYRWAHLFPKHCPELSSAVRVLGIGDVHIENFGTWRDGEGRLVWGVNDFDEACYLPYTNDLVRLAASACLAITDSTNPLDLDLKEACRAIQEGYVNGIEKPRPFVLAEDHGWLRKIVLNKLIDPMDKDRKDLFGRFFKKYTELKKIDIAVSADAMAALNASFPQTPPDFIIGHREAGLGSLGRMRITAVADWQGGIIVREAKALAPSAWLWANQALDHAFAQAVNKKIVYYYDILSKAVRSIDPWLKIIGSWVVRRLGPDAFKVEIEDLDLENSRAEELTRKLLRAMGKEIANVHSSRSHSANGIAEHLGKLSNKYKSSKWLFDNATKMVEQTRDDFRRWRETEFRCPSKDKDS